MKTITQKLIAVLLATVIGIGMASAQTKTITHTVVRGETLESIAKRYGTTNEKIIELNPDAADFIYVGMDLSIPVSVASEAAIDNDISVPNVTENKTVHFSNNNHDNKMINFNSTEKEAGWGFAVEIFAGFPDFDIKGCHPISYEFGLSVPYWIKEKNKGLFAAAGLAYESLWYSYSTKIYGNHITNSTSYSLLAIPLKVGFAISGNDIFALTPFVGFNLGISVKGSSELISNGNKDKIKIKSGKFAPDFRLGTFIRLLGFDVGGYFAIPISDDCKAIYGDSGYFGASIAFGY